MASLELADACRLEYQQVGEGPDLVLVHGLATNRAFWYASLAQALKHAFRVTLYDLRGHGYSSLSPQGYSAADQAGDLAALLEQAGIESADVVGHSYGGGIALEFAVQYPQLLRRLVLMDSRINTLQPEQRLADSPHLSAMEIEIAERAGLDWDREPQVGLRYLEVTARLRAEQWAPQARDAFTPFGEGRGGMRGARQYLKLLEETEAPREFLEMGASADEIARIAAPTLLLYGERSRCLPSGRALAATLPDTQFRVVPDAGHFFPASHAALIAGWTANFLGVELPAA
ncbi:alpha/beta hydrolase [Algiphilus sp. W345]|uniref:Alpha/beta hydrolase n=1 Tax=Banduia mediterranea TaxID=3075609 RepID=A0ABU2WI15_9GAMM|nr:alpha/beta hydrolase [Algiphilus sp. W345]MDT0497528.1 alpha/beta hydrolase [Algiphilus sp. W345]